MYFLFIVYNDAKFKQEKLTKIGNKFCGDNLTNILFFSILEDFKNVKNAIHYSIYCCHYWGHGGFSRLQME